MRRCVAGVIAVNLRAVSISVGVLMLLSHACSPSSPTPTDDDCDGKGCAGAPPEGTGGSTGGKNSGAGGKSPGGSQSGGSAGAIVESGGSAGEPSSGGFGGDPAGGAPATGGAENLGNPCTGPGAGQANGVSGFPPGPTKTLTSAESWTGWGISHGNLDVAMDIAGFESALHTAAPGDSRTSYFLAPPEILGDLSDFAGIRFALKTVYTGGAYFDSGYQYKGDVVLKNADGGTTAYAIISHAPDAEWHYYYVPFEAADSCWSTPEESLAELLTDVTGLGIRAEFSTGTDDTWLSDVTFVPR